MVKEILQKEAPLLRKISKDVPIKDIDSTYVKDIIEEMRATLSFTKDGVALAAPQIGHLVRIFVVSPKAFDDKSANKKLVYINPKIIKKSSIKNELEEGCLSVRDVFGLIKRHEKVTVEAYDERGKKFTRGASGLLAEIFQHETDHLDGKLFIDRAKNLREIVRNDD